VSVPLRVAVVGLGWMGTEHARILADRPDLDLVAVVDRRSEHAVTVAGQLGTTAVGDFADVVGSIDAVSICTPDHAHEELVLAAISHGLRVIVEKPMATSVDAAARMLAASPDDATLTVGHLLEHDPRIERARQMIDRGDLGDLWHARVRRHASRAVADHVASGSSVGWFGTIHDADLLLSLTGSRPTSVHATGRRGLVSSQWDVIDATVMMESGVYGTLHESWTLPAGRANRSDSGIAIIGSGGGIEVDLGHGQVLFSDATSSVAPDVMHYPSVTLRDRSDLETELHAWARTLRTGVQYGVGARRAFAAVALVDAIHRSLESGMPQDVVASPIAT